MLQMGFGFEITDKEGNTPPFLYKKADVQAAMDVIQGSFWASVDMEGTGLTDASDQVNLDKKQLKADASADVRMRTIQVRVPLTGRGGERVNYAFDLDRMKPGQVEALANMVLSRPLFIAHNAGFDLYWLRRAGMWKVMPKMVLDTMLLTRLLDPKHVMARGALLEDIETSDDLARATPAQKAAWKSLVGEASGTSLADVVLAYWGVVLDKTYQKPQNWTGLLSFAHYDYAVDDVIWADRIACKLLGLDDDGDIYRAYLWHRANNARVRLLEPQVPELVELREHGMPINPSIGRRFADLKATEIRVRVAELIEIEPTLAPFRDTLADPDAGRSANLTKALATAFTSRGVALRYTAATAVAQVGEKDLRACRAAQNPESKPLFDAWVGLCRAKKTRSMALDVVGFSQRSDDGRIRALLSHGPITGRLAAAEPNCFTGETEILTTAGWVRFDQLPKGLPVAQYEKGALSFVEPTAYIEQEFSGNLVSNSTRAIRLLTTPDHRCLLISPKTGKETVVTASQYKDNFIQLHAANYVGGPGLPLSDQELQFLVAAQADGSWRAGGLSFNFYRPRKIERFAQLFGFVPQPSPTTVSPSGNRRTRFHVPKNHPLTSIARQYLGKEKAFGSWVFQLSRAQIDLFLAEVPYWDGLFCRKGDQLDYATICRQSADLVQALYAMSDTRVRLVAHEAENRLNQTWRVQGTPHRNYSYTTNRIQKEVPYTGKVYCVSVPSSYIMVRHEGAVMITGQCQQWPRDQIFRAMCMSDILPGCATLTLTADETTAPFFAKVAGRPVAPGEVVELDTAWLATMFVVDKLVAAWPDALKLSFGAILKAQFSHTIVASDFGALDVRVGAALAIRAQREILAIAQGTARAPAQLPEEVLDQIHEIGRTLKSSDPAAVLREKSVRWQASLDNVSAMRKKLEADYQSGDLTRKQYFKESGRLRSQDKLLRFSLRWAQCLLQAIPRGSMEYSALRDAFVADIDIHTFTGMKLVGRDPMKEFDGLSLPDRKALEKKLKKELGPRRQQGKIANLSLLYGMADAGFQEAAARGYDEHWTMEEAHDIRALWMDAYPEVELWHLWTEYQQLGVVYQPDSTSSTKKKRKGWWMATTLAGREIVALGLNAALSYQDQSTGADILGMIMHELKQAHAPIFDCAINQVHDEVVFAFPVDHDDEYLATVEAVMVGEANKLTMPYGVPCAVSPACGQIWIKD